jgi:hypothetical protein
MRKTITIAYEDDYDDDRVIPLQSIEEAIKTGWLSYRSTKLGSTEGCLVWVNLAHCRKLVEN